MNTATANQRLTAEEIEAILDSGAPLLQSYYGPPTEEDKEIPYVSVFGERWEILQYSEQHGYAISNRYLSYQRPLHGYLDTFFLSLFASEEIIQECFKKYGTPSLAFDVIGRNNVWEASTSYERNLAGPLSDYYGLDPYLSLLIESRIAVEFEEFLNMRHRHVYSQWGNMPILLSTPISKAVFDNDRPTVDRDSWWRNHGWLDHDWIQPVGFRPTQFTIEQIEGDAELHTARRWLRTYNERKYFFVYNRREFVCKGPILNTTETQRRVNLLLTENADSAVGVEK